MEANYYALLIGINEYKDNEFCELKWAVNDCLAMKKVLTNVNGCFDNSNVVTLIDENATIENIQQHLVSQIVKDKGEKDVVLVYFSGHAFQIPYQDKVYIATNDTFKHKIIVNPFQGISLAMLYDEIFKTTQASSVVFVLDTCYSGAIAPNDFKSNKTLSTLINETYVNQRGRVAIVSSPPNVLSREDDHMEHGVLTYWLLKGLTGEAVDYSGNITVDGLVNYIKQHAPEEQPFGRFGLDYDPIILAHYDSMIGRDSFHKTYHIPKLAEPGDSKKIFSPMHNQLEKDLENVFKISENLKSLLNSKLEPQKLSLETIRLTTNAELTLLLRNNNQDWNIKAFSKSNQDNSRNTNIDTVVLNALQAIVQSNVLGPELTGVYLDESDDEKNSTLIIPLRKEKPSEILLIHGSKISEFKNDTFSQIMCGFYNASHSFSFPLGYDLELIEGSIADYIKTHHSYVPLSFYDHRFKLFESRLGKMTSRFQPIIHLSKKEPYIASFEALAYDDEINNSPSDLFLAAEQWGDKFTLQVDLHFLTTSIQMFRDILSQTPGRRRPEDIPDLSVNVYPSSLIRTRYFELLKEIIDSEIFPNHKLFLEISEKQKYPIINGEGITKDNEITDFRGLLEKYVNEFGIGFAIDDFGIGYSSVERLAKLHPGYLKIDRELLLVDDAHETIGFILDFMNTLTSTKFLRRAKVVVEGFDLEASRNVKLDKLYDVGVRYIQGYILGEPCAGEIARLDNDEKNYLISLVKGLPKNGTTRN